MSETLWLIVAIAGGALCVAALLAMQLRTIPALVKLDKTFRIPDMRLRYGADALFACFDGVGEPGQHLMTRYWRVDFLFIAGFLCVMAVISRNNAPFLWLRYAMYGLAAARAALDATENLVLLHVCGAYPGKALRRMANACGWVTTVKFVMLGLWVLGLFVALFLRAAVI